FDGRALHFPEHTETRPVEQASAQAAWLARELSSALGERVAVVPVIALPGWFVDTPGGARGDVIATNGKGLERFLPGRFRNVSLDETRRQRIGHAILRLYPSIGDSVLSTHPTTPGPCMIHVRATAKLLKRLRLPAKLPEPEGASSNPLGEWYADIDFIDREPFVLLLNAATGVGMVVPGRAAELRRLHEHAHDQIGKLFRHFGLSGPLVDAEIAAWSAAPTRSEEPT